MLIFCKIKYNSRYCMVDTPLFHNGYDLFQGHNLIILMTMCIDKMSSFPLTLVTRINYANREAAIPDLKMTRSIPAMGT